MKKFSGFKILLSIMLSCAMFLPNVSAYYSVRELEGNDSPFTVRYPMDKGDHIGLSHSKLSLYEDRYNYFLDRHPSHYRDEACKSGDRKLKNIYEEEIRHIGATSYATVLFLGCTENEALEFSTDISRLCDLIIGYPQKFDSNLLLFVANYTYNLLGEILKQGVRSDLNAVELYRRISTPAYVSSSMYCALEGYEWPIATISEEMFRKCITPRYGERDGCAAAKSISEKMFRRCTIQ